MPQHRKKKQCQDFLIGGLKLIMFDDTAPATARLAAADRLAIIDGVYDVPLVPANRPPAAPIPSESSKIPVVPEAPKAPSKEDLALLSALNRGGDDARDAKNSNT